MKPGEAHFWNVDKLDVGGGERGGGMTVKPVANWPSAWRKSVAVRGVAGMIEVFEDTILRGVWRKARAGA